MPKLSTHYLCDSEIAPYLSIRFLCDSKLAFICRLALSITTTFLLRNPNETLL